MHTILNSLAIETFVFKDKNGHIEFILNFKKPQIRFMQPKKPQGSHLKLAN